jgi:hypothetical protein
MESAHMEEVEDGGELAASYMPHRLHRGSSVGQHLSKVAYQSLHVKAER